MVSYRFNDDNKKVKVTRRIKTTVVREQVNPQVAERRSWSKFGLEKGHATGPSFETTSVGENIVFRPSVNWKVQAAEEEKTGGEKGSMKDQLKDKKVKCRICSGEHFTARCPFKDTMAPIEEPGAGGDAGAEEPAAGGLGATGGSYVPPHLRKGAAAGGEKMAGKYEKDDLATLRVTNVCTFPSLLRRNNIDCVQVSELAEEQELRDLFERFGRVTRVFLARDRETQRAKGFAFISFADRDDAARACEKMDGCRFSHVTVNIMAGANWNSRLPPLDSPRGIRQTYLECFLFGLTTIGRKNGQGETASLRVYALLIMIDPVSMLPVRMIKALFCHNEYSLFQTAPGHRATLRWQEPGIPGISRELAVTHGNGPAQCTRRRKASWEAIATYSRFS